MRKKQLAKKVMKQKKKKTAFKGDEKEWEKQLVKM